MTCRQCRDLMLEVARHRAAPFVDRSVRAHTAQCGNCSRRLEQERQLSAALRAAALAANAVAVSPAVEADLMAAFAAHCEGREGSAAPVPLVAFARGPATTVARSLALAAAVVLITGAVAWRVGRPARVLDPTPQVVGTGSSPLPSPPSAAAPAVPSTSPAMASANPGGRLTARAPRAAAGRRPMRAVAAPIQAVGFEPIPSAAGLPDFESGEIVRLGIPVTALPNYGIEIPAGAQSAIQADLLIGQDGQARAIRLVDASAPGEGQRRRQ